VVADQYLYLCRSYNIIENKWVNVILEFEPTKEGIATNETLKPSLKRSNPSYPET